VGFHPQTAAATAPRGVVPRSTACACAAACTVALRGGRPRRGCAAGARMMVDPSAVGAAASALPDAAVYLSVAGSLTGASPLVLMDKTTANLAIGAVSGMVAAAVVFPIDTAKTRIQTSTGGDGVEALNTFQMIQLIARTDGVPALYKGLLPVMVGSAPESAVQLTVFELSQKALRSLDGSILQVVAAGMIAGCAQLVVTNPLEVLKITAQTSQGPAKSSLQLVKELGPGGLFRGWRATLLRDIPFAGLYFSLYTQAKSLIAPLLLNPLASAMLAGLVSGMVAAAATTPGDVIKTNIQATKAAAAEEGVRDTALDADGGGSRMHAQGGVLVTAKTLYAQKGWRGFFSGVDARVTRQAPAQGVCLCVFECLQAVFRRDAVKVGTIYVAVSDDVTGVKYFGDYRSAGGAIRDRMAQIASGLDGGDENLARAAAQEPTGFVTGAVSEPLLSDPLVALDAWRGLPAVPEGLDKATSVVSTIDLSLAGQSPATAAAALSQDLVESVVVPVWGCGGLVVDLLDTCVNQGVAQF